MSSEVRRLSPYRSERCAAFHRRLVTLTHHRYSQTCPETQRTCAIASVHSLRCCKDSSAARGTKTALDPGHARPSNVPSFVREIPWILRHCAHGIWIFRARTVLASVGLARERGTVHGCCWGTAAKSDTAEQYVVLYYDALRAFRGRQQYKGRREQSDILHPPLVLCFLLPPSLLCRLRLSA